MATANQEENISETRESVEITEEEFKEFLSANAEKQFQILLAHAEKNKKIIKSKKIQEDKNERNRN